MHLFAGAGGGILADILLGHQPVCAVENNNYCQQVLAARQKDGCLPWFPIFEDVRDFDGRPWRGLVDVVSGGFPCQDISVAGNGAGIDGERSGLWKEFARIIDEVRPRYAFIENSPMLTNRGLDRVLCDLTEMGFNAEWGVISAADTGAPHIRERIWILAYATDAGIHERRRLDCAWKDGGQLSRNVRDGISSSGQEKAEILAHPSQLQCNGGNDNAGVGMESGSVSESGNYGGAHNVADTNSQQRQRNECAKRINAEYSNACGASGWSIEPALGRVANGVAHRVDRLKAIGNGQVPRVAATAWRILNHD
jgi:DNA (cytosine-5)-methyltransferase 1